MGAGDGKGIKRPEILVNFWKKQVDSYSQINQSRKQAQNMHSQ